MTALTLDDRNLLTAFTPDSLAIRWDADGLDWTATSPLFCLSSGLRAGLDRLRDAGLIEPVQHPDLTIWPVQITPAGVQHLATF